MPDVESDRGAREEVDLRFSGDPADGPHRCADCGYGVAVYDELPRCPMCSGETWDPVPRARPASDSQRLAP